MDADAVGIVVQQGGRARIHGQPEPLAGALSAAGDAAAVELALRDEALERLAVGGGAHHEARQVPGDAQEAEQQAGTALRPERAQDAAGIHLKGGPLAVLAERHVPLLAGE